MSSECCGDAGSGATPGQELAAVHGHEYLDDEGRPA
jgi:hypothetical protein